MQLPIYSVESSELPLSIRIHIAYGQKEPTNIDCGQSSEGRRIGAPYLSYDKMCGGI